VKHAKRQARRAFWTKVLVAVAAGGLLAYVALCAETSKVLLQTRRPASLDTDAIGCRRRAVGSGDDRLSCSSLGRQVDPKPQRQLQSLFFPQEMTNSSPTSRYWGPFCTRIKRQAVPAGLYFQRC
jgi:hypothetical protein